jgi:hypothetical protein
MDLWQLEFLSPNQPHFLQGSPVVTGATLFCLYAQELWIFLALTNRWQ